MSERAPRSRIIAFLAFTLALSLPFWWWGVSGGAIIPGLPVSGLMAFTPAVAAVAAALLDGRAQAAALLRECFDVGRLRGKLPWLALNVALFPALLALAALAMLLAGVALPALSHSLATTLAMFAGFFVAGLGEEIGWFGYAFPALERRRGALSTALLIGLIWMAWHVVPYFQTGRAPSWIAWHCLATVATRVVAAWLFVNTGRSVLGAAVFHAMCNVSYFSFPSGGSHYDAAFFAPIVAGAALLIVWLGGLRTRSA
jgi:membrane protease YdiL (CAAX protease family)